MRSVHLQAATSYCIVLTQGPPFHLPNAVIVVRLEHAVASVCGVLYSPGGHGYVSGMMVASGTLLSPISRHCVARCHWINCKVLKHVSFSKVSKSALQSEARVCRNSLESSGTPRRPRIFRLFLATMVNLQAVGRKLFSTDVEPV